MKMPRCKSTITRRSGEKLQCEHTIGHDGVHFNGDVWWPNKHGLPLHRTSDEGWLARFVRAFRLR